MSGEAAVVEAAAPFVVKGAKEIVEGVKAHKDVFLAGVRNFLETPKGKLMATSGAATLLGGVMAFAGRPQQETVLEYDADGNEYEVTQTTGGGFGHKVGLMLMGAGGAGLVAGHMHGDAMNQRLITNDLGKMSQLHADVLVNEFKKHDALKDLENLNEIAHGHLGSGPAQMLDAEVMTAVNQSVGAINEAGSLANNVKNSLISHVGGYAKNISEHQFLQKAGEAVQPALDLMRAMVPNFAPSPA